MAKKLNKNRMIWSKLMVLLAIIVVLFSPQTFAEATHAHHALQIIGVLLLAICALGRLYSTAFLGGHKNESLIDYGIFSLMRNPLYVFSFIGTVGIAFLTAHLLVIIILPLAFIAVYVPLVRREQDFLLAEFGTPYKDYLARVPAFLPRFSNYHAPETIDLYPQRFARGFLDAIWWPLCYPLIELIEYGHAIGFVPYLFDMPAPF